jgi:predicted transcriptional regulator
MPVVSKQTAILSFRAPTKLVRRLTDAARRDDRPMSAFARRLLTSALDQYEEREQTTPA